MAILRLFVTFENNNRNLIDSLPIVDVLQRL